MPGMLNPIRSWGCSDRKYGKPRAPLWERLISVRVHEHDCESLLGVCPSKRVSEMERLPKILARTVAAAIISGFWCISAVVPTVGLTTLATAINAATITPAEARRRYRGRRYRRGGYRRRGYRAYGGYPYYGYGYPYRRRRGWGGIGIRVW